MSGLLKNQEALHIIKSKSKKSSPGVAIASPGFLLLQECQGMLKGQ
ncbi:hypothetical protein PMIT1342_02512 [Prochlorococcus marinus str. MIT 1342]|nr:hypothetical protein PMIT1342_02512 [Prochlorococcus marinus str. MIT 1342]